MASITIVIPFYQKQTGILQRALRSISRQVFQDFDILVVDDESPLSAESELQSLGDHERARVTVIRQANAGPGGARNTGLDNVPAASRFVAFLDSDDEWAPEHLSNAFEALTRHDADCYWDSISGGEGFSYHFGMEELAKLPNAVRLSDTPAVIEIPNIASEMLKDWGFLHLSCMVIGRPLFEKIRFEAALRLAAEDLLFFCDCILAAKRVLLCEDAGALRGEGMNIFHSIDNDSPQFLRQQFNTWTALNTLEERFLRRPQDIETIRAYKNRARQQALWSQARQLRRRRLPQLGLLAKWAWRDPGILQSAMRLAAGKFTP
ncbi:glycosyltransferase family 2 protein [Agrobacterium rhizogenes]|uniref:Glycosyltransferase 2-like domain-containing protein n=1 Tax=Rhizobium rhizogenes NBRC 13257 TaxID=1220581 RepID=A0AA87QE59_RHIRH|nr:glycosyltransferase family 2 protein [Rhizobium rhizogenes]KAA6488762.1 glycosyltransferase family 2 protein [Agrobacterium sp. ICMP 7243]OCJ01633.1 succinoglycan biosynthesis protein exow [Agrobacterium sp. 13-626]OCJ19346.1 succinoglycan biosynthesis protein exow [Agrobacterium sp. B133/95]KEA08685.1 succinoglycan biosynthesis protein exow [Rhizobium rhizogenes]MQB30595.1 glycosyltransferase family 2 protein [Rhizobium rhizogenes]